MKVNYRRTVEKQREEAWDARQKEREELLSKMSDDEREQYIEDEQERIKDSLSILSYFGQNGPYSKL